MGERAESTAGLADQRSAPVFLVGAGRSGTTWLQMLLTQHPAVASAPETNLFAGYVSLMSHRWDMEAEFREATKGRTGLHGLISRDEFLASSARPLVDLVLGRILARKPGAAVVLEKTPDHVLNVPLILELLPNARFIHIIRDPRAVVASLRAAGKGWGKSWAPRGAAASAMRWKESVKAGLAISSFTPNYYELKYESLSTDTVSQLYRLFRWLDIESDTTSCQSYMEACRIDRLRSGHQEGGNLAPHCNTGEFFRKGASDAWQTELSRRDIAIAEKIAGDLMGDLGYATTVGGRAAVAEITMLTRKAVAALRWRVTNILLRIEDDL